MLTPERHRMILELLKKQKMVTVHELTEATESSESTIRRDLDQLEQEGKLHRFHGGAESLHAKSEESAVQDRLSRNQSEKIAIGRFAAELVQPGDCIYLDAGTTTAQMIPFLHADSIVVTNGLTLVDQCLQRGLKTYLIGGEIKVVTRAVIGRGALESIETYRFDKCFMGMNGVHERHGYTTPDPDEALIKKKAIELSTQSYVLADDSKLGTISFSQVAPIGASVLITNQSDDKKRLQAFIDQTQVEVVTA